MSSMSVSTPGRSPKLWFMLFWNIFCAIWPQMAFSWNSLPKGVLNVVKSWLSVSREYPWLASSLKKHFAPDRVGSWKCSLRIALLRNKTTYAKYLHASTQAWSVHYKLTLYMKKRGDHEHSPLEVFCLSYKHITEIINWAVIVICVKLCN